MTFLLGGANSASGGYNIDNSLRVGSGRTLSRTFTEVSAERKKHTLSCWIKLGILDGENHMIIAIAGSNNAYIRVNDDHKIRFRFFDNSQDKGFLATNRLFRDPSAWYHIMLVYDSAQSTASNRVKIYVNGVQETSFSTETYPDQNEESIIGNNAAHSIEGYGSGGEFYVAEWYYIGNQALSPSDFGETNDNGVWVPKKYTGSFGSTNDTFLEFKQTGTSADASGIGADTSGEGNHMASTNLAATDVTTDTPTNNFATFNSVDCASNITLTEGNTVATANTNHSAVRATMGFRNGKWYWEQKVVNVSGQPAVGIFGAEAPLGNQINAVPSRLYRASDGDSGAKYSDGSAANYGDEYVQNDIIGVAVDMDNGAIYFSKNGTFQDSGDPTSGSNKTNAAFTDLLTATSEHWLPAVKLYDEGMSINFGNPSHSISSGNADANGYGNFEYAPPSGYYSLCTKNLAEFG